MRCLVTGAAGFIGSHLAQALVAQGHDVVGVDCLVPYYGRLRKEANLREAASSGPFQFLELDLHDAPLARLLGGSDVVFHLAGQPGVRSSWGNGFADYVRNNVTVTHRLLEASERAGIRRFVYASSSSVYGNTSRLPTRESDPCRPFSPYGVSKLAAENLCTAYADNGRVETVSLRYFTVYGPRQRPDMAFSRFISMALRGNVLPLYAGQVNLSALTSSGAADGEFTVQAVAPVFAMTNDQVILDKFTDAKGDLFQGLAFPRFQQVLIAQNHNAGTFGLSATLVVVETET